ncbi:hypothetical protein DT23_12840 [Thioclava indica]|uniref:Uncharacterized protein n=1 Tax=Thioclava indica TaxID=1353528 RepID=A0A074KGP7_9RHOB|nr:hypothetical protein DT23_12840 [Thioclava indica]
MTVQGESAASPPVFRPEARRPARSFFLAQNIPAGGNPTQTTKCGGRF